MVPQLSCPIALFTYYNPILKRGVEKFMITVKEVGIHGNINNASFHFLEITISYTVTNRYMIQSVNIVATMHLPNTNLPSD